MGALEVVNHVTLDGVMQAPGHPDEDRRGGFEHGGWAPPYADDVQARYMGARMSRGGGAILLGRRTYDKFAELWTQQPEDHPVRQVLEQRTKYVVTREPRELGWVNTVNLHGDAADAVRELKPRVDGTLVILGSGELVRALLPHDLIDAFVLTIHPLVLGAGARLFGDGGALARFTLAESAPTTTGVLITRYERAATTPAPPAASGSSPS